MDPILQNSFFKKLIEDLRSRQFFYFIFAGLCSASISIVSRIIFQIEFSYFTSVFLASLIGMLVNFSINKNLVFRGNNQNISYQFLKFIFIGPISLLLTPVSAVMLLNIFEIIHLDWIRDSGVELLAHIGALIINSIYGFFALKYFVFK